MPSQIPCDTTDFAMRGGGISASTPEGVRLADSGREFRKVAFHAARFSGEFTEREKSMMYVTSWGQ